MAEPVERLDLEAVVYADKNRVTNFRILYRPIVRGVPLEAHRGEARVGPPVDANDDLVTRMNSLIPLLSGSLEREALAIDGEVVAAPTEIGEFWIRRNGTHLLVLFKSGGTTGGRIEVAVNGLSPGQQRLLSNIMTSLHALAWTSLREAYGMTRGDTKPRIFISYRKGHEEFAESLARRLGREGFEPWFDEWEVRAGDSLPGKIEEGLSSSLAFIAILTADYQKGRWATEELESAIHRRIEEGFPIIPVLLDDNPKPELIRHLVHVDFSDHDPDRFETKCADVVDAINRLDRNPFR